VNTVALWTVYIITLTVIQRYLDSQILLLQVATKLGFKTTTKHQDVTVMPFWASRPCNTDSDTGMQSLWFQFGHTASICTVRFQQLYVYIIVCLSLLVLVVVITLTWCTVLHTGRMGGFSPQHSQIPPKICRSFMLTSSAIRSTSYRSQSSTCWLLKHGRERDCLGGSAIKSCATDRRGHLSGGQGGPSCHTGATVK
jgi:hypothetical protein